MSRVRLRTAGRVAGERGRLRRAARRTSLIEEIRLVIFVQLSAEQFVTYGEESYASVSMRTPMTVGSPSSISAGSSEPESFDNAMTAWTRTDVSLSLMRPKRPFRREAYMSSLQVGSNIADQ